MITPTRILIAIWVLVVAQLAVLANTSPPPPVLVEKFFFASPERLDFKSVATFCVRPEFNDRFRAAVILTPEEASAARAALMRANKFSGQVSDGWIAGYRPANTSFWLWPDRSRIGFKKSGQAGPPVPVGNGSIGECLALKPSGVWRAAPCGEKLRAVCEGRTYTKVLSYVARDKMLDRNESELECEARGGRLATFMSHEEAETGHDRLNDPDPQTPSPTTRSPTPKPTRGKKVCCPKACCTLGNTFPPPSCPNCECCCCNILWKPFKYARCCKKNGPRFCGCGRSGTRTPTIGKRGLISSVSGRGDVEDFESQQTHSLNARDLQTPTGNEFFVFIGAINEKVGYVKEENASFIWRNGVSFKPIGYLPLNVSNDTFTNWETYPLQVLNHSCALMSNRNGKWRSARCDTKANGALCEFRSTKKRYRVYPDVVANTTTAGFHCALTGGQVASIKSMKEWERAKVEIERARTQCSKCFKHVWLNGNRRGRNYYWNDGQLLARDGLSVGFENTFQPGTNGTVHECLAIGVNGLWAGMNCSSALPPLCEYRTGGDVLLDTPRVDPKACFPGCLATFIGDGVW